MQDSKPALPVIALGTSCLTAFALRRLGLNPAPMPFDWLRTSAGMIRHCLATDFSMLLDRGYYRSLTGQRAPGEPVEGCAHAYYAREHGIGCVFNHGDPTQDAAYRYLRACVDRFREVILSDGAKIFVQISGACGTAQRDFEENADLLDRLTQAGNLLQVTVDAPDKLLASPRFSVVSTQGAHTMYRMQPTSKMDGEDFFGAVDNEAIGRLIARYTTPGGRDFSPADLVLAPASVDLNVALENARLTAHIANRGDTRPDGTGWTGSPGSGLAIQGVVIHSGAGLDGLSYQVAEGAGQFSALAHIGHYAGTRGQNRPVYGLRVRVTQSFLAAFRVSLEVSFVDGTAQGPEVDRNAFDFVAEAPLEAIRLLVTER